MISLLSVLTCAGLSGAPADLADAHRPPAAFHQIAFVSDPLSHGTVGDGLLSLNEAIRLHNGTLDVALLSLAEQNQVSLLPGSVTTDVTWIEIDSEAIPMITLQQDLESIVNTPFGLFIRGSGSRVNLDLSAPGVTRGIHSTSSSLIVQGLGFVGGVAGLEVVQADATGQPGCTVIRCKFENLSQFGVRVEGTLPGGVGRLIVEDSTFVNVSDALVFDESPAGRTTIFEARDVRMEGVVNGFDFDCGGGGTARFTLDRCVVEASATGLDVTAPVVNGRSMLVEGTHLRVRASLCAKIDGAADTVLWADGSMWSLLAPAGGTSLQLGGVGQQVYGDLRELRCAGDVSIASGAAPLPLNIRNMRARDGAVALSTQPGQSLTVSESRFVDCDIDSFGTGAVVLSGSSFEGGSVGASTPAGLLQADGCFLSTPGPGVVVTSALAQAHLGSLDPLQDDVVLGGTLQLQVDLPTGLVGAVALGEVPQFLPLAPAPYYLYVDPAGVFFLPGLYSGQQVASWQAPIQPLLYGAQLVVQAVVLPIGIQAPPIQFPPGWRLELR